MDAPLMLSRCGFVAALVLGTTAAYGQPTRALPSRVRIEPLTCTVGPFDTTAWLALVRSEFETDGIEHVDVAAAPGTGEDDALAVVHIDVSPCRDDASEVAVSIDDLATRKTVRRVIALDDVPAAGRARALALAVAELLRASWAEFALDGAPTTAAALPTSVRRAVLLRLRPTVLAERPPEAPLPPPPPSPLRARHEVALAVDAHSFLGQSGSMLGGRAAFGWRPFARFPLRLRGDLGIARGEAFARRGQVSLSMATIGVAALFGGGTDGVELTVGPRIESGVAWATGTPSVAGVVGDSGVGAVLFLSLAASLRVAVAPHVVASVDLGVGETLYFLTVSSDEERVTGLRGTLLHVALGGSYTW
jgi:hypothetical protein